MKCHEGDRIKINFQNNRLTCGKSTVTIPTYSSIDHDVNDLKRQKQMLCRSYIELFEAIIDEKSNNVKELENLIENIQSLDGRYYTIMQEYDKMKTTNEVLLDKLKDTLHESKNIYSSTSAYDPSLKSKLYKLHKEAMGLQQKLQASIDHLPGYYAKLKTKDSVPTVNDKANDKATNKEAVKKKVLEKKPPSPHLSMEKVDEIKSKIKDLLKSKFKPKTLQECTSRQHSKAFYMSKEDLIKQIEATPEIKKLMPANYKTLSKEKICENLPF